MRCSISENLSEIVGGSLAAQAWISYCLRSAHFAISIYSQIMRKPAYAATVAVKYATYTILFVCGVATRCRAPAGVSPVDAKTVLGANSSLIASSPWVFIAAKIGQPYFRQNIPPGNR
jgi:hypothetical protein